MGERIAGYDFGNEGLHTIAVLADVFQQMIHYDFVVTFKLAAQGIGQQFFRQVPGKLIRSGGEDGF